MIFPSFGEMENTNGRSQGGRSLSGLGGFGVCSGALGIRRGCDGGRLVVGIEGFFAPSRDFIAERKFGPR